ncbi:hypothetical protein FOMG_13098 [Fusarium oxysporum f. sp. melonis 26406]|uniref:Uncharacterized protein n=1 Tax=Fusarium oxysporum f. sp. melonis 26406 TaxID=1089452 RepID=X0ADY8_FUSOX|nr:hypothetical protein FOMG_13098 [Fusarium oxysporum f. sp. melonis 26406]
MRIDPRRLPTREGTQAERAIRLISAEIRGFGSSVCINKPAFAS